MKEIGRNLQCVHVESGYKKPSHIAGLINFFCCYNRANDQKRCWNGRTWFNGWPSPLQRRMPFDYSEVVHGLSINICQQWNPTKKLRNWKALAFRKNMGEVFLSGWLWLHLKRRWKDQKPNFIKRTWGRHDVAFQVNVHRTDERPVHRCMKEILQM